MNWIHVCGISSGEGGRDRKIDWEIEIEIDSKSICATRTASEDNFALEVFNY